MTTYLVTWSIDIDADSHEEAAIEALAIQRDNNPENAANVFLVREHNSHQEMTIDLSDMGAMSAFEVYCTLHGRD